MMRAAPALLAMAALLSHAMPAVAAADPGRFVLISADGADELARRLGRHGPQGYALLAAAPAHGLDGRPRFAVLLERSGSQPVEYEVLSCDGNLGDGETTERIRRLGAAGYRLGRGAVLLQPVDERWLPQAASAHSMTLIFERRAGWQSQTYELVGFGDERRFYEELGERRANGGEIVGMWNSPRRLQVVLERVVDAAPSAGPRVGHRLLYTAVRATLKSRLRRAAVQGWRIVAAADPTVNGPPLLLLEQVAEPSSDFRYRFVDKLPARLRKQGLERLLNRRGRQGWRVAVAGVTGEVMTLQRPFEPAPSVSYRTLSSRRAPGLPQALEAAVDAGYRFVALFAAADETIALVEKPAGPGAAVPR